MRKAKALGIASSTVAVVASLLSFVAGLVKDKHEYLLGGLIWLVLAYINVKVALDLASREPRRRGVNTS